MFARSNLTFPIQFPPPPTCIRFLLIFSSFSYSFLLSSQRSTSHSAWMISGTIPVLSAVSTLEVAQRVLQKRLELPTIPEWLDVGQMLRVSGGRTLLSYFPLGSFPGWLSSANFPLVLETMWMTSSQVSFPPLSSLVLFLTRVYPRVVSCHERGVPCSDHLLPRPHRPKRSISLSQGATHQTRKQQCRGESVDIPSANPSRAHPR